MNHKIVLPEKDSSAQRAWVAYLKELYPDRQAFMKEINRIKNEVNQHLGNGKRYDEGANQELLERLKHFANAKAESEKLANKPKPEIRKQKIEDRLKIVEEELRADKQAVEEKISPKAQKVLAELSEKTAELRIGYES